MNIHLFLHLLLVSSGIFLVGSADFPSDEVIALTKFKEAIYEDPSLVLSSWNDLDSDPCNWNGISCSMAAGDHVLKINISGASLKGFLAPDLHLIPYLEELILNGNLLMGTIPKEIGLLKNLRILDLGNNRLTGSIPKEIGNLPKIEKINLQSNGLSGRFPSELISSLKYLEELRVDRNKLLGMVLGSNIAYSTSSVHGMYASGGNPVGVCRSSKLKVADFSYNFFVGRIPKCLSYLPKSSFRGNCLQVHDIKQRPLAQCGHNAPTHKIHPPAVTKHKYGSRKPRWLFGLEVMTGIMAGTLFLAALLTTFHKFNHKSSIVIPWKKSGSIKDDHTTIYVDTEMLKDVVRYSREEVEVACEDFSNIIVSSTNSLVYKGTMKGGPEIAVISVCVKEENWTAYLELYFQKETAELARIDHENAAKLLGYCRESSPFTRMLVFEYAPNGTLYEHLHYGEACQLSWTRRMKIVIGIAKGLKYLQTELKPPFTISELNSSSVYLTEDFTPKLVDFESWETILSRSEKNYISSEGAICILPNSLEGRHLDFHGNLYAFGLLLLEIISGRPPYCKDKGSLLDWAKEFLDVPEVMSRLVDPELKHFRYEELEVVCEVIKTCVCTDHTCRSSMADLCGLLESKIDTSISAELSGCSPSLAWAQLALSSP